MVDPTIKELKQDAQSTTTPGTITTRIPGTTRQQLAVAGICAALILAWYLQRDSGTTPDADTPDINDSALEELADAADEDDDAIVVPVNGSQLDKDAAILDSHIFDDVGDGGSD